jgi:uracil-DNA glycosylase family 4
MKSYLFDPNEIAGKIITKPRGFIGSPCKICSLYRHCKNPKATVIGEMREGILIVSEIPDIEDKVGKYLKRVLNTFDIDLAVDCGVTSVLQCRPPNDEFDSERVVYCYERLEQQIKDLKPELIMCFGLNAIRRILETDIVPGLNGNGNLATIRGDVYPSRKYNAWVSCHYHPTYIMLNKDLEDTFYDDVEMALTYLGSDIPDGLLDSGENQFITDEAIAIEYLNMFSQSKEVVSFDYETNMLEYYKDDAKIILVSLAKSSGLAVVLPIGSMSKKVHEAFIKFLKSDTPKLAHNSKFEENWSFAIFGTQVNNWYWDTILSQHIIDQRRDKKGLEYLVYQETGEEYKSSIDRKHIEDEFKIKPDAVIRYSGLDARFPLEIMATHENRLGHTKQLSSMDYLVAGNTALSRLEQNGVQIDEKAFRTYQTEIAIKHDELENVLMSHSISKKHGTFNPNSNKDLDKIFSKEGIISETGSYDDNFLNSLHGIEDRDIAEFAMAVQDFRGIEKLSGTYLNSIEKYVDSNWLLHPNYNLWIAATFRSSSSDPNLQNLPKRDDTQKGFRKIFVAGNDYLMEADYKGAEVVMQAMLAQDFTLIDQLNKKYDIHRYWASKLYQVIESKVSKKQRFSGKSDFFFPKIYGSSYKSIARSTGLPKEHVKKVEAEFYKQYQGVAEWQAEQEAFYSKNRYVKIPLGFRRYGPLRYTQIVNTPIQGGQFLCFLLDTLIQLLIEGELEKRKMKSLPVLQVHDSIVFDIVYEERDELMEVVNSIGVHKEHLGLPNDILLQIEWESGENWAEMKEVK